MGFKIISNLAVFKKPVKKLPYKPWSYQQYDIKVTTIVSYKSQDYVLPSIFGSFF